MLPQGDRTRWHFLVVSGTLERTGLARHRPSPIGKDRRIAPIQSTRCYVAPPTERSPPISFPCCGSRCPGGFPRRFPTSNPSGAKHHEEARTERELTSISDVVPITEFRAIRQLGLHLQQIQSRPAPPTLPPAAPAHPASPAPSAATSAGCRSVSQPRCGSHSRPPTAPVRAELRRRP